MENKITLYNIFFMQIFIFLLIAELNLSKYLLTIAILISLIIFIILFSKTGLKNRDINTILIGIFSLAISLYFKSNLMSITILMSLLLIRLNDEDLIKVYGMAQISVFIISTILSLIGIRRLYNFNNHCFEFGFGQKNFAGYYLLAISFFIFKNIKNDSWIKKIIVMFCFVFIEFYLIKDRTASYLLILFLVIYNLKLIPHKKIFINFISILPILLTILTIFLTTHYNQSDYIIHINNVLSGRIYYWNYYWNYFKPHLFPQNTDILMPVGTGYMPLDSAYLVYLLSEGYILYFIIIFLLSISVYKTIKNKNYFMFSTILTLILFGFTESHCFNGQMCFLLPYAFSIFSRGEERVNEFEISNN